MEVVNIINESIWKLSNERCSDLKNKPALTTDPVMLRILRLMDEKGISGKSISDRLGLANGSFSQWKYDDRRRSYMLYIDEISRMLDTTPTYLIRGDEEDVGIKLSPQEIEIIRMLRKVDKEKSECIRQTLKIFVKDG